MVAVSRLVYIAAFAPDKGESVQKLIANPAPGAPVPPILPPVNGFLMLDKAKFAAAFAGDVPAKRAAFLADAQVPWGVDALAGEVTAAAWRSKPSWYLVAKDDKMIPPDAQRAMSKRAGATVVESPAATPSMSRSRLPWPRSSRRPRRQGKLSPERQCAFRAKLGGRVAICSLARYVASQPAVHGLLAVPRTPQRRLTDEVGSLWCDAIADVYAAGRSALVSGLLRWRWDPHARPPRATPRETRRSQTGTAGVRLWLNVNPREPCN